MAFIWNILGGDSLTGKSLAKRSKTRRPRKSSAISQFLSLVAVNLLEESMLRKIISLANCSMITRVLYNMHGLHFEAPQ